MSITSSLTTVAFLTGGALLSACASGTKATVSAQPAMTAYEVASTQGQAYSLMILRASDAAASLSRADLARITTEHTAFVEQMTESGFLLSSGAMIPPRAEASLRGLYFCDSSDVESAYARACSDPATEAGAFTMEAIPFVTSADLRAVPAMDRGARLLRGDRAKNRSMTRPFIVCAAPSSAAMEAIIAQLGETAIFHGQCTGGSMEGMTLCVMNCTTPAEARNAMGLVTGSAAEFQYHPWQSSASLVELADDAILLDLTDRSSSN